MFRDLIVYLFCLVIVLVAITFLAACGRDNCRQVFAEVAPRTFGTLEAANCAEGEVMLSVKPHYLPGGEIVTHVVVRCATASVVCE